ncbi:CHAT domain-containing tetratricopeptide repeat protein [Lentzea sp. NPDC004789]
MADHQHRKDHVKISGTPRQVWWLGFWQTAEHVHWWLSSDQPDAEPPEVGSIPRHRLASPLNVLMSALPGLTTHERTDLAEIDHRIERAVLPTSATSKTFDAVTGQEDVDVMAAVIADRIELLARRATVLDGAARRSWTGAMVDVADNLALLRELGSILLPQALRGRLERAEPSTARVIIAPGPGLSFVPWELLVVDDEQDVRLIERADVLGGISPGLLVNFARPAAPFAAGGPALRVVDPIAAGSRTGGGRIYPDGIPDEWHARSDTEDMVLGAVTPAGCSPGELGAALRSRTWSQMVFVGHASAADTTMPTTASLEFAPDPDIGEGRLTAGRWLREPEKWPAPRRVAFIACQSDDAGYAEQIGLTLAALNAGARTVTTTRWSLPSDGSEHLVAGGAGIGCATTALALAVDEALTSKDPAGSVCDWQRDRLRSWRSAGTDAERRLHAPLVWASLVTYDVPEAAIASIPVVDEPPPQSSTAPDEEDDAGCEVPQDAAEAASRLAAGTEALGRADWSGARDHYLVALAGFLAADDRKGIADATINVGNTAYFLGELDEAERRYRAALPLYRELGIARSVAIVGQNLGNVCFQRGELDLAANQYREAADDLLSGGFQREAADTLVNLSAVLVYLGRPQEALKHLDRAGELYGETCGEGELEGKLAELNQNSGLALAEVKSFDLAREHLQSALRHWTSVDPSENQAARTNHNLGLVAFRAGNLAEAHLRYSEALAYFLNVGNHHDAADTQLGLGMVARRRGEEEEARVLFRLAQHHYRQTGQWLAHARALFNEGLTFPEDSFTRFALLGGAWAAMQSMSWRLPQIAERAGWRTAIDHATDDFLRSARLGGRHRHFAEIVESLRISGTLRRFVEPARAPESRDDDRDELRVELLPPTTLSSAPLPWTLWSAADEVPCDAPPWIDCGWPIALGDVVERAQEILADSGSRPLRNGTVSLLPLLHWSPIAGGESGDLL